MPSERDKASENLYEAPQSKQPQGKASWFGRVPKVFGRVFGVLLTLAALPAMTVIADVSFAIGGRRSIAIPIGTVAAPLVAVLMFGIGIYMIKTAKS